MYLKKRINSMMTVAINKNNKTRETQKVPVNSYLAQATLVKFHQVKKVRKNEKMFHRLLISIFNIFIIWWKYAINKINSSMVTWQKLKSFLHSCSLWYNECKHVHCFYSNGPYRIRQLAHFAEDGNDSSHLCLELADKLVVLLIYTTNNKILCSTCTWDAVGPGH